MDIVFVFTNFNNTKFTDGAVFSIANSDAKDAQIIVVDNSSNDCEVVKLQELEKKCQNLHVIYNHENVGYFRGLNIGIKYAREHFNKNSLLVIGNNDLVFPKNFYSQISASSDIFKKYPVISPNIVTTDGIHQNPHVISTISKPREFIYDLYHLNYTLARLIIRFAKITHRFTDRKDELQHDVAQEICQGYGACYILGPVFFQNFEVLWSPTFLMYEEFFLSMQLDGSGFKVYYEPSITVQHHLHSATAQLPGKKIWEMSRDAHHEYRKYVKVFDINVSL